jgi:uncharacterized membrane protein YciS (DUF1049 family)
MEVIQMTAPQWTMIVLLVIEAVSHNIRVNKYYNDGHYGINMVATVFRMGCVVGVLIWGGFWN